MEMIIGQADIIGVAQTGTGKTLAFAIPVIQRLARNKGQCLVLVPTRELALQVNETFQKIAPLFGIKTVVIIGGVPIKSQLKALRKLPREKFTTKSGSRSKTRGSAKRRSKSRLSRKRR